MVGAPAEHHGDTWRKCEIWKREGRCVTGIEPGEGRVLMLF